MKKLIYISIITIATLICPMPTAAAQIVNDWSKDKDDVVTTLQGSEFDNSEFIDNGIINDWAEMMKEFEEVKDKEENPDELLKNISQFSNYSLPGGISFTIPYIQGKNNENLFFLTTDGITIFLNLNTPAYYNETIDPDTIIKWVRFYGYTRRQWTKKLFRRYEKYAESFENVMISYGIPPEMCMLTLQESGCNPNAKSPVGAAGIWQFMPYTAKKFGLEVSEQNDERYDTYKAARAAAKLLNSTYRKLGNWTNTLAAYNCGSGRIETATKKAGTNKWDEICPYLPKETRNYVPGIIALHYLWTYRKELDI